MYQTNPKTDTLLEITKNGLTVFEFPIIASFPGVQQGISTRQGGFSQGDYSSLNVSFGVGDSDKAVIENRRQLSGCFENGSLVFADQVHGTEVRVVSSSHVCKDKRQFWDAGTGDAMITNVPGLNLVIQIADCQAVMMVDPENQVVANVHVGWRGNVQNIVGHTLHAMKEQYNTNPADLRVGISPSLGPCCAEFINYRNEFPEYLWRYKRNNHHFDLWSLSRDQLCKEGVLSQNISISRLCTRCSSETFFSYRAQKKTGRFAAVIGLT
jgi:YfiH family protein